MNFVAISKVNFPPGLKDKIQKVGLEMMPIANTQPGFVSVAFHESYDQNETMMYWEWESKGDHENCMKSDDWLELMSKNKSLFETEGVTFSINTYKKFPADNQ